MRCSMQSQSQGPSHRIGNNRKVIESSLTITVKKVTIAITFTFREKSIVTITKNCYDYM